ncbi:TLC domain-containing protein 4 isoform X2 [Rousettus aegyptiacus]|uniref:TLC domain-containing protein 4 isoform X2 n=1 Tax=Rousettus aegyptiacus TaxID=9407 RepID=UPI00168CD5C8|nr:TLC domain-containing protein 4 isoform X2 [Rousettus aegyptiacus]
MDTNTILNISTVFASFFTFQLLFYFLSDWFSAKVSTGFNSLSSRKKIEWNSRVGSTYHSLVVGVIGLYLFFFDEATITDPLWGDSWLVKLNVAISSGYLISDLLILILYWKVIGDKYFIIHHCTALCAFFFILKNDVLEYVGNFRLLAELSSPFVNQRSAHDSAILSVTPARHVESSWIISPSPIFGPSPGPTASLPTYFLPVPSPFHSSC